jgi:hypothetical protein
MQPRIRILVNIYANQAPRIQGIVLIHVPKIDAEDCSDFGDLGLTCMISIILCP